MQPNQRSRKPRSQRSRPPRRSFPGPAVVPDAPALQPATEAPAVAAIDSRANAQLRPLEPRRIRAPGAGTQATANEAQATPAPAIEESRPTRKPPLHRPRRPAAPATGPEPRPAFARCPPGPETPSCQATGREILAAPQAKVARKKLSVSPAAPLRRNPPGHLGSSNRAFATLPGIAQTLTSPVMAVMAKAQRHANCVP